MKIVKDSLFEFHKTGEPLKQLNLGGIKNVIIDAAKKGKSLFSIAKGFSKEQTEDLISQLRGNISSDLMEDLMADLAVQFGAAFEIYLNENDKEHLFWLIMVLGKKNIKIIGLDVDDPVPDKHSYSKKDIFKYLYKKNVKPYFEKGWELFHREDNYDFQEIILIRYEH